MVEQQGKKTNEEEEVHRNLLLQEDGDFVMEKQTDQEENMVSQEGSIQSNLMKTTQTPKTKMARKGTKKAPKGTLEQQAAVQQQRTSPRRKKNADETEEETKKKGVPAQTDVDTSNHSLMVTSE
eukprot:CAMPEP_0114391972 /NCGR_PEP_ID=MMETSP0102-20121206/10477_1 /TAXON_ID=38822 ORGANISM="Pteridomonas danica, Strain PT" /NCGR_SAMPLE_ID=MMETSP0102 /ASSEMBLY_ACC=CAM_ASM_000212 /LENGTH=123 /DNA_ID=CAMNT_0001550975 /DNA_START=94 /DNA_END=462 /DNA_ORIENTATION=+